MNTNKQNSNQMGGTRICLGLQPQYIYKYNNKKKDILFPGIPRLRTATNQIPCHYSGCL